MAEIPLRMTWTKMGIGPTGASWGSIRRCSHFCTCGGVTPHISAG